jgi:hypothetical protein
LGESCLVYGNQMMNCSHENQPTSTTINILSLNSRERRVRLTPTASAYKTSSVNLSSLVKKLRHEIIYPRFNDQSISVLISTPIDILMSHSPTLLLTGVCLSELVSLVKNTRIKEIPITRIKEIPIRYLTLILSHYRHS